MVFIAIIFPMHTSYFVQLSICLIESKLLGAIMRYSKFENSVNDEMVRTRHSANARYYYFGHFLTKL